MLIMAATALLGSWGEEAPLFGAPEGDVLAPLDDAPAGRAEGVLDVTRRAFDVGDAVAGSPLSVLVACDVGPPRSIVVVDKEPLSVVAAAEAGRDAETLLVSFVAIFVETALDTGVESPVDAEPGNSQRLPDCPLARTKSPVIKLPTVPSGSWKSPFLLLHQLDRWWQFGLVPLAPNRDGCIGKSLPPVGAEGLTFNQVACLFAGTYKQGPRLAKRYSKRSLEKLKGEAERGSK